TEIEANSEELLADLVGGNHRSVRLPGKFSGCSRRLCARPVSNGIGLCCGHHVSRSKDLETAQDNRTLLSSSHFEILGNNSNSGMGISSILDFCGGLERAQWMGSLS